MSRVEDRERSTGDKRASLARAISSLEIGQSVTLTRARVPQCKLTIIKESNESLVVRKETWHSADRCGSLAAADNCPTKSYAEVRNRRSNRLW